MAQEHESGSATTSASTRRRRRQVAAGIVGLAVLGGGSFLITQQLAADDETVVRDPGALAPLAPATEISPLVTTAPASAEPSETASSPPSAKPTSTANPSRSLTPEERVAKARAEASKDGIPLQRPLVPTGEAAAAAGPVDVRNTGSLAKGGTMRIVTARYDLTGQREQAWAADDGEVVGSSRCTQNVHFTNDSEPRERPTMLVCWRTSQNKSVVTVAVVKQGRPDATKSVAVIDGEWAKLD